MESQTYAYQPQVLYTNIVLIHDRTGESYSIRFQKHTRYNGFTPQWKWHYSHYEEQRLFVWMNNNPQPGDYKHFNGFYAFCVNE